MRRALIVAAVLVLVCAGPARARPNDQRSSHRFIAASVAALSATIAGHGRIAPAVDAVVAHVTAGCPGALATTGAPSAAQTRTREALLAEADDEASLAVVAPIKAVYPTFARRVGRLHWTLPSLDRLVASSIRTGLAALVLAPPDVCADIATAAASGFAAIPPETSAFVAAVRVSLLSPGPTVADLAHRMRRYVGPRDASAIRRLDRLSRRLGALYGPPLSRAFDRVGQALDGP